MPANPYKRPVDERWYGYGGREPINVPGNVDPQTRFGRPTDERWYGPLDDADDTPTPPPVVPCSTAAHIFATFSGLTGCTCVDLGALFRTYTLVDLAGPYTLNGPSPWTSTFFGSGSIHEAAWADSICTDEFQFETDRAFIIRVTCADGLYSVHVELDSGPTAGFVFEGTGAIGDVILNTVQVCGAGSVTTGGQVVLSL